MTTTVETCSVDGCERPKRRRDWCGAHYARHLRHGSPTGGGPDRQAAPDECVIDGCARRPVGRGLCNPHWKADRLANDPEYRERKNAAWRAWADEHGDYLAEAARRYRAENADTIAERMATWRAENRSLLVLSGWTRRRRLYGLPDAHVDLVDPDVLFVRDDGTCQICGTAVDRDVPWPDPMSATVDHIVPVRDPASTHSYENTQLAHWDCNRRKNAGAPS